MSEEREDDDKEVEAVLALLAVGAPLAATAASIGTVLTIPAALVVDFLRRLGAAALKAFTRFRPNDIPQSAVHITDRANLRYRAAFIRNALRRIFAAPDKRVALRRELEYWKAHLKANLRRLTMARRADAMRRRHGPLLGWYAEMDTRTTAECRAADGRNFEALKPPVIGYPGSVHMFCRCVPGPPIPGAKLVNDSLTVRQHGPGFHH